VYSYRNRWYLPEAGVFAERDPFGYADSPNLLQVLGYSATNTWDPYGEQGRNPDNGVIPPRVSDAPWLQQRRRPPGLYPRVNPPETLVDRVLRSEDTDPYSAHLTLGIGVDFWAANSAERVGRNFGLDFQFWIRDGPEILDVMYVYDSKRASRNLRSEYSTASDWFGSALKETGIEGFGLSVGGSVSLAKFRGSSRRGYMSLKDDELVESWKHRFNNVGVSTAFGSLGGFWSPVWRGVAVGPFLTGAGTGGMASVTDYERRSFRADYARIRATVLEQISSLNRTANRAIEDAKVRAADAIDNAKEKILREFLPGGFEYR